MHITSTPQQHTSPDVPDHTRAHAHTFEWTHTPSITEAEKAFYILVSLHTHCSQLLFYNPHNNLFIFFVKTMMWQASCCVFGGLLIISRLSDQQPRVVTFRAGFLCIGTKDRVWWHLTKQPVRPVDVIKTKSIISYVLVPNWCVGKKKAFYCFTVPSVLTVMVHKQINMQ